MYYSTWPLLLSGGQSKAAAEAGAAKAAEAEVRRHHFEETRLRVALTKSEEARMRAEKRAQQATKRSDGVVRQLEAERGAELEGQISSALKEAEELRFMLVKAHATQQ
eukprot:1480676-Pyramimonas_sp.AAC.1